MKNATVANLFKMCNKLKQICTLLNNYCVQYENGSTWKNQRVLGKMGLNKMMASNMLLNGSQVAGGT